MTKSVVILGGGTAGWLSAIFIKNYWPDLTVTVIEDPKRPPIIAGESGNLPINGIYNNLGIDIIDWVKETGATPKQGGEFYNWNGKGHKFYHSLFSEYYTEWAKTFPSKKERYFYFRELIGSGITPCDIPHSGQCVKENLVPFDTNTNQIGPSMWHFDSRANAAYLKKIGLSRNISLIEGEYQKSNLDHQGNIESLVLDNDRIVPLDWAIDCSGFARLLLEKVMNVGKTEYADIFPARAVIAWWDKPKFNSATIATAMDAGWSWQIGIKQRTGQGYLYDPDILTPEQALDEIRSKFGEHAEPVASIKFSPCVLDQVQKNNVIGLGLSTGFLEPLEANGVGIITDSLEILRRVWNPWVDASEFPKEFNQSVAESYEAIKNFLSLHYRGKGLETKFWKEHQTNPSRIPESLTARLEEIKQFYLTGKINLNNYSRQYSLESWITVVDALGLISPALVAKHESNEYILRYYARQKERNMKICKDYIGIEEWAQKF